eukprot:TRINITY_DN8695_c0_g1_i4.p1 TRINITY_DN8695_c0_g1~~TRINITY_DN8695_c0_g1_i4.p1  ORF type:complete len:487 (+),score=100.92 TRINITY_DN8695_c0_g1_i4:183-1643(+)
MNHCNVKIFIFSIFSILGCNHGHPDSSYKPGDYQYDAAASYDYDYGPDSSYSEEELAKDVHKPVILSQPSQIQVELGHTIRLPCTVDRLPEALQILWTRVSQDHIIIAMGDRILAPAYAKRANVTVTESGSTLVISSAKVEDAGEYKCSVALDGDSPPEIVHVVSILGPTTAKLDEPEVISAKQGDDVTLSCSAVGHPTPHLSWTREGKHMPDGTESIAGEKITLENVSPKHAGTYTCTAANGNGSPVSNRIVVNIEYKPIVELEEVFVHTQAGNKVEIVCKVHGHPHPAVEWRKDGEVIKKDKKRLKIHHFGSKHSLSIKSVKREDYGSYSCQASNYLGSTTALQEISGKASPAQFKSSPKGTEESSYLLEWSSMSYTPITEFHLETRQAGSSAWRAYSVSPHADQELYHSAGKLYLTKLERATAYQARVKSHNKEGMSRWSHVFNFATRGGKPKQEQMTQSSAGKQLLIPHIIFSVTFLILRFL